MNRLPEVKLSKKDWVLIVEDEEDLSEILRAKLESAGFGVIQATKVSEALFKASNQKFTCILLDMRIKQGSGETVLDKIKLDYENINYKTPVIVMSAYLNPNLVRNIVNRVHSILIKPFKTDELTRKVSKLLGTETSEKAA